jgi:hypothetical protein
LSEHRYTKRRDRRTLFLSFAMLRDPGWRRKWVTTKKRTSQRPFTHEFKTICPCSIISCAAAILDRTVFCGFRVSVRFERLDNHRAARTINAQRIPNAPTAINGVVEAGNNGYRTASSSLRRRGLCCIYDFNGTRMEGRSLSCGKIHVMTSVAQLVQTRSTVNVL